jgi:hypothetical protein
MLQPSTFLGWSALPQAGILHDATRFSQAKASLFAKLLHDCDAISAALALLLLVNQQSQIDMAQLGSIGEEHVQQGTGLVQTLFDIFPRGRIRQSAVNVSVAPSLFSLRKVVACTSRLDIGGGVVTSTNLTPSLSMPIRLR